MDFQKIEKKLASEWEKNQNKRVSSKGKFYVLNEFPYPSGSGLHVGHAFSFTGGDVYARFKRMQGYEVMFPMGWDAFGLPTENYAIKMKRKPQEVTKENTDMFRSQMKRLAFSFDWEREVNTTSPDYYKWTQWIFVQLFKKGLAYKEEMPINWCPSCKIGLANEEVVDGKCERCQSEVSRRNISQWIVKITDYADKLVSGLEKTDFIEKVKQAQINWIGKSEGAKIKFQISNFKFQNEEKSYLEVFTTRPDTLYGATFMVMAPEHKLALELAESNQEVKKYLMETRKKSDMERMDLNKDKTGVFSGLYAINPVNNKEIPIWISDFVLASYGTGAIMSVPAHDERDKAFAEKYSLPIIEVLNEQEIMVNSENWNGLTKKEAIKEAIKFVEEKGIGKGASSYHLRDWIFSRQHYWGEPIPMIFCKKCAENQNLKISNLEFKNEEEKNNLLKNAGWISVPEEQLPIVLPEVEAYEPTDDGKSPLSKITEFVNCKCPVCGSDAVRETDTMPNWAGSDWYFLRYMDPHNDKELASQEKIKYWGSVDVYIGGDEHNTLHLLYSRFIYQFLHDIGAVPAELPEPYFKRISHGVILGPDNNRMSKSKGNVVVPEVVADKYGVDVVRMYLMFMGPFDGTMAWNEKTLMGVKRFLDRVEKLFFNLQSTNFNSKQNGDESDGSDKELLIIVNKAIRSITDDMADFGYNTVVAKLMKLLTEISNLEFKISKHEIETYLKLLAPMAPYTAEEMWHSIGNDTSVHDQLWPEVEEKYLREDSVTIMVAVNGKVREQLLITNDQLLIKNQDKIIKLAKELPKMQQWLEGKTIKKEIYVNCKMVNFVI